MEAIRMEVKVIVGSIEDKRKLEYEEAANVRLKADLDYVAMMSDINIVTDESEVATNE